MKKEKWILVASACFVFSLVMILSSCNFEKSNEFDVKLFDSDWNEIESYNHYQEIIYTGEEYIPYNAIAYCNGVEFARLDFADRTTLTDSRNPLKISINDVIGGQMPTEKGYYDIAYTFWYDRNTPKDLPNATGYHCPYYTVVIDTDFDYSLRLFDNGNEITEEEYTVKFTGENILPEVFFYRGENLALSYSLDQDYTYNPEYGNQYDFQFFINGQLIFQPHGEWYYREYLPLAVGRYDVTYLLFRNYHNIGESRFTNCKKHIILNIVE